KLISKWKNHRDCHIEPDWILIYRLTEDSLILERTGSHSELFK
ncbi:MAG: type II toxin-antitoxin system YafQ family toxin, partial [Bacteroidetes bacterium]|nr:type II toxin-antitoxin system YafQ family toxin [Bacteroidota bacterium]